MVFCWRQKVEAFTSTTGMEFARRDAPPTPVQVERTLPHARALFPLGEAVDARPWMGARPCLTDMVPVVGKAPRHAVCGSISATSITA
jgi:D-amino-acid dehydrogenase